MIPGMGERENIMERVETTVKIVDNSENSEAHVPQRVYVNGQEVLVSTGGLQVYSVDGAATSVSLTLLPTRVEIVKETHDTPEELPQE